MDKSIKSILIKKYTDLLSQSIIDEEYILSDKYKKILENLKKLK